MARALLWGEQAGKGQRKFVHLAFVILSVPPPEIPY